MNLSPSHLHLILNHIPILGTMIFAPLILVWGLLRHSRDVVQAGLLLAIILALTSIPVYLSGDRAEEQVERESWFDKTRAQAHEERAEAGLIAVLITGAGAVVALARGRKGKPLGVVLPSIVLAGLVVSAALFAAAAVVGGEIRHTEIRSGAPAGPGTGP
jgi:hypothetical protein